MNVTSLYADVARCKSLWAHCPVGSAPSDRYGSEGVLAADKMAAAPATSLAEVLLKLAELQDITAEDANLAQKSLITALIADVQRLMDEGPTATPASATLGAPSPSVPRAAVRIDRRARPTIVDGVVYPSITAAAAATGRSYSAMLKESPN